LLVHNLGGVVGALLGGWWMGRAGSRIVLMAFAAVGIVSTFAIGFWPIDASRTPTLMTLLTIARACTSSVQVQMYTVAASAYPTELRATGVGWALGTARLGGVLSAFSGSVAQAPGRRL